MSYILDALRKAQAERERGQVPGLEARPLAEPPPPAPAAGNRLGRWIIVLAALPVLAATLYAWRQQTAAPGPQATAVAGAPGAPAAVVMAPPAAPPASAPLPMAAAPAPAPHPAPAVLPLVVSAPVAVPAAPAAVPAPAASPPLPALAQQPAATAAALREVRLAALPPELRRLLPALASGGAMWSENVASRFVIIDGQVLREGESVAPGVVVERIAQKTAWLRWRDWRIELPL